MRALAGCCLFASLVCAQAPAVPTVLHGVLLEHDAGASGEFSVRAPDFHVIRFRFDAKTVVERERQAIDVPGLRPGEEVEVTSDRQGDEPLPYALEVHVAVALPAPAPKRRPPASRLHSYSPQEERLLPKGDLSFSGVVVRLDSGRLVLRTRAGVEQTIVLRQDTRYLENGEITAVASLKPTMHVNIRGSKNLSGDIEGYQIAWGQILEVH
jgi:hypothetical protein